MPTPASEFTSRDPLPVSLDARYIQLMYKKDKQIKQNTLGGPECGEAAVN